MIVNIKEEEDFSAFVDEFKIHKSMSETEYIENKAIAYYQKRKDLQNEVKKLSSKADVDDDKFWNYVALLKMNYKI